MDYEITIIGAGIAGSVLASYLSKQGVEICLIDRLNPFKIEEDSEFSGRTAALNLASINLLAQLELWNDLKEDATDFDRIYVWDSEGSSKLEFLAKDIDKIKLGSVITNNRILKEISKTLESSANVDLKFNREIDGINTKNNSVEVITGEGEKINSKLLVGADGGRSIVRKLVNISTRTWSYGQTAFVTTLKSKKRHKNTAWQIFTSSGPIALLPFSNGKGANISLVWSAENDYAEVLKSLEDNNFVLELEKKTESILGSFELQDDLRFFPLNQLHVKNYFSKRTLLVGDAAHTIHPLAGQGLNLGFADILSLQQVLISARRRGEDIGTNKVLSKYENSRKLPNLTMIAMMELFKQGFNNTNPWIRLGRNLAFQTTQESGWIKKKFIKEAAGLT